MPFWHKTRFGEHALDRLAGCPWVLAIIAVVAIHRDVPAKMVEGKMGWRDDATDRGCDHVAPSKRVGGKRRSCSDAV
jgi:hypothetical protein